MNKKGGLILLGIAFVIGVVAGIMLSASIYKFTYFFKDDNPLPQSQNQNISPSCIEKNDAFTTISTNYTGCEKCCSGNCTHYEASCPAGSECLQAHRCL